MLTHQQPLPDCVLPLPQRFIFLQLQRFVSRPGLLSNGRSVCLRWGLRGIVTELKVVCCGLPLRSSGLQIPDWDGRCYCYSCLSRRDVALCLTSDTLSNKLPLWFRYFSDQSSTNSLQICSWACSCLIYTQWRRRLFLLHHPGLIQIKSACSCIFELYLWGSSIGLIEAPPRYFSCLFLKHSSINIHSNCCSFGLWMYPQVLQKLGKTMETKDEQFELCSQNLTKQQVPQHLSPQKA